MLFDYILKNFIKKENVSFQGRVLDLFAGLEASKRVKHSVFENIKDKIREFMHHEKSETFSMNDNPFFNAVTEQMSDFGLCRPQPTGLCAALRF